MGIAEYYLNFRAKITKHTDNPWVCGFVELRLPSFHCKHKKPLK